MRTSTKVITMCCLLLVACAAPWQTQALSTQESIVQRMALSARLYAYSIVHSDPLAAMNAAAIRKSVTLRAAAIGKPDSSLGFGKALLSWQDMLLTARKLANSRADLEALIDDIGAVKNKGLLPGAIISKAEIGPRSSRKYFDLKFEGGAYAEVYSEGHDMANIDMFIFNEAGDLVCAETDLSPVSLCSWT
ncbi:MAG: hypothetical protein ABJ349_12880, partial [Hyphomicrobiales bacterium]